MPPASTTPPYRRSRDHDPVVLQRLLALRQTPVFGAVELAELVPVAENVVESVFVGGEQVAASGTRVPSVHFVLDGRIEIDGDPRRTVTARQVMGLLEVLSGRRLPAPALAPVATRTLELEAGDLFEILEDNFAVLSALIRMLAARALALGARCLPAVAADRQAAPLDLVARMIVIRRQVPFFAARIQPLTLLAHAAREITWLTGETIAQAGEPTREVYMIIDGALAGTTIGALEVLADAPQPVTLTATSPTRALALAGTTLFDVLEDYTELGIATAAALAGAVLDAEAQGVNATGTTPESNSRPVPSMA